jgi:DNA-directed RNA polymerase subunit omega
MNSDLQKQALAKVGNPNILVNIVSRRVRQLTSSGSNSRPLISDTAGLGAADIALVELIEDKIGYDMLTEADGGIEAETATRINRKKRKKS